MATGATGQGSPHTDGSQVTATLDLLSRTEAGRKQEGLGVHGTKGSSKRLKVAGDTCHRTQLRTRPREPGQQGTESHLAF